VPRSDSGLHGVVPEREESGSPLADLGTEESFVCTDLPQSQHFKSDVDCPEADAEDLVTKRDMAPLVGPSEK